MIKKKNLVKASFFLTRPQLFYGKKNPLFTKKKKGKRKKKKNNEKKKKPYCSRKDVKGDIYDAIENAEKRVWLLGINFVSFINIRTSLIENIYHGKLTNKHQSCLGYDSCLYGILHAVGVSLSMKRAFHNPRMPLAFLSETWWNSLYPPSCFMLWIWVYVWRKFYGLDWHQPFLYQWSNNTS